MTDLNRLTRDDVSGTHLSDNHGPAFEKMNAAIDAVNEMEDGVAVVSAIDFSAQPVTGNTLDIGTETVEYDGAGDNINVAIAGSAAATLSATVTAFNAATQQKVAMTEQGTDLRVAASTTPGLRDGGAFTAATRSVPLAATLNSAAEWSDANLDADFGGRDPGPTKRASGGFEVTADMVTKGDKTLFLGFEPRSLHVEVLTSTGVRRGEGTDTFVISGSTLLFGFAGGAAPNVQAGDFVHFVAVE